LRILHISHTGLPDSRIEKTAATAKKNGHRLFFVGGRPSRPDSSSVFEQVLYRPVGNDLNLALNPLVKRRWLATIDAVHPDIVHAHNAHVARYLLGTDYPVVYDDHEFWSKQTHMYTDRRLPRGLASRPMAYLLPKWERELLQTYPTITVHPKIAELHRRICRWVGVTQNFPSMSQVSFLEDRYERSGIVYVGSDFFATRYLPARNMKGIGKVLKFSVIHGLPHPEMMESLMHYRIGITPWLPHPIHIYTSSNKNFEYLHAGLQVVVNYLLKKSFTDATYVHAFHDYSDIRQVIKSIRETDPRAIMEHARRNFVWEKQEQVIRDAYRVA